MAPGSILRRGEWLNGIFAGTHGRISTGSRSAYYSPPLGNTAQSRLLQTRK